MENSSSLSKYSPDWWIECAEIGHIKYQVNYQIADNQYFAMLAYDLSSPMGEKQSYEESIGNIEESHGRSQFNDPDRTIDFDHFAVDFVRNQIENTLFRGIMFVIRFIILRTIQASCETPFK